MSNNSQFLDNTKKKLNQIESRTNLDPASNTTTNNSGNKTTNSTSNSTTNNSGSSTSNSNSTSYNNSGSSGSNSTTNSSGNSGSNYSSNSTTNNSGNTATNDNINKLLNSLNSNNSKTNKTNNSKTNNNKTNNSKSNNNKSNNNKSNNDKSNNNKSNNNESKKNNKSLEKKNNSINKLLENIPTESNINQIIKKINNESKNNDDSIKKTNNDNLSNNLNDLEKRSVTQKIGNTAQIAVQYAKDASESSIFWRIVQIILIGLLFLILVRVVKYYYSTYENYKTNSPWLVEGNKNAKHALVISQDPKNNDSPKIKRSDGKGGIELSYHWWMLIEDFSYRQNEWKHVFHKGNEKAYPTLAPGVFIHPNRNVLRIYMNTLNEIYDYVDIDNIPIKKWFHCAIVVNNDTLEVYINGYLKTQHKLNSLVRQNNEDLWVNLKGGFDGYLSKLRYFNYATGFNEISDAIKKGPAHSACIDSNEVPPYLDNKWWH